LDVLDFDTCIPAFASVLVDIVLKRHMQKPVAPSTVSAIASMGERLISTFICAGEAKLREHAMYPTDRVWARDVTGHAETLCTQIKASQKSLGSAANPYNTGPLERLALSTMTMWPQRPVNEPGGQRWRLLEDLGGLLKKQIDTWIRHEPGISQRDVPEEMRALRARMLPFEIDVLPWLR